MEQSKSSPSSMNKKFSDFVFQTNRMLKRGLKSESFVESSKQTFFTGEINSSKDIDTQTKYQYEPNLMFRRKVEVVKETCTQTSLTNFIIAPTNSESLSPDSLSPKHDHNFDCIVDDIPASSSNMMSENIEQDSVPYNRKNSLKQYLDSSEDYTNLNLLTGNTLTKTFLKKNRHKTKLMASPSTEGRPLSPPLYSVPNATTLRSHSYVESPTQKNTLPYRPRDLTRFKVVNVNEKEICEEKIKPVRYFCQSPINVNFSNPSSDPQYIGSKNKRSMSFMSPTIASEKKDQSIEIKYIGKLISPTRRGRSASPKKFHKENSEGDEVKKVPYIDKSELSFKDKPAVHDVAHKLDESIEKQLHLDLRQSCEDLHNITAVRSLASTTSTTELVLFQALTRLRDRDWTTSLRGLAEIVEITRAVDVDLVYPHMTTINQRLVDLIRSPRSHVTRTACQAVGHLFEYVKDTRRPEFDELVDTLLCKTADSNKFIRHDANLALDCMVTHIPTFHAIRSLCTKGPEHKNPLVRIATARLIVCAVVIAGPQNVLHPHSNEYTRRRIILNLVKFLNDKNLDIRKFGERLYKLLYKDRIFDVYLKRYLDRDVIMKIKKCMRHSLESD